MVPSDHVEQVLRCLILVRQDERLDPESVGCLMVVPSRYVCATPLLPALEDQRADAAGLGLLLFQPRMNVLLRPIKSERLYPATLGADAQTVPRVEL
jgi:hypothetical protein